MKLSSEPRGKEIYRTIRYCHVLARRGIVLLAVQRVEADQECGVFT